MESRKWQGPTVLIAPAVELIRHGGKKPSLAGFPSPVFILHGKRDSLISPERSWELAATRDLHCNHIVLDILDDDHAMNRTLAEEGRLATYVRKVLDMSAASAALKPPVRPAFSIAGSKL
eukprot:gnl/TRDRNA2_/TRDRNA2_165101_c0_seq2.p3 gnl/TRDRNA2_/TRDRNA2_165101_c0~~gnl/TRDRNA2_/TRDRNA2_165101_c0_seq2.p3  ORF type:complete len:120 (+),score=22.54 gnl/TRDRNA2_/TRDRNA2_165101_c0_seq2:411-770(+)